MVQHFRFNENGVDASGDGILGGNYHLYNVLVAVD